MKSRLLPQKLQALKLQMVRRLRQSLRCLKRQRRRPVLPLTATVTFRRQPSQPIRGRTNSQLRSQQGHVFVKRTLLSQRKKNATVSPSSVLSQLKRTSLRLSSTISRTVMTPSPAKVIRATPASSKATSMTYWIVRSRLGPSRATKQLRELACLLTSLCSTSLAVIARITPRRASHLWLPMLTRSSPMTSRVVSHHPR